LRAERACADVGAELLAGKMDLVGEKISLFLSGAKIGSETGGGQDSPSGGDGLLGIGAGASVEEDLGGGRC
jgi:hypothetical protein